MEKIDIIICLKKRNKNVMSKKNNKKTKQNHEAKKYQYNKSI